MLDSVLAFLAAILPSFLAFLVGAVFSGYELLNSLYPMTCYFLLKKSKSIYIYSLVYGIFSFVFMLGIHYFGIFECVVAPLISNVWVQAIFVGISTKAFLHIKFFDADPIPIGFETITYLFEPRLLSQIKLDDYNATQEYITDSMLGYHDIAEVLNIVERKLPSTDREISVAFMQDVREEIAEYVDNDKKIMVAMELYLRAYGVSSFNRSFPSRQNAPHHESP
jgi:hypothetical protein